MIVEFVVEHLRPVSTLGEMGNLKDKTPSVLWYGQDHLCELLNAKRLLNR